MRIVFIGSVEFSLRALEKLMQLNAHIVGVCTLGESRYNADYVNLTAVSDMHKIPCLVVNDINSKESIDWIKEKSPDVIFCFGWSRLLGNKILNLSPLGVIGFHPAALPSNRGRHPLIWALVLGLEKTATTFFFMDEGADSGDILSQKEIVIDREDDARSLYNKVIRTALEQIECFLPKLASGNYTRLKQDDESANTWRKRGLLDGKIDWRMSAKSIHNLVRGLSKPYVGAHFNVGDKEYKVWKTGMVLDAPNNIEPGKIYKMMSTYPIVKCGEDAIALLSVEPKLDVEVDSYI